MPAPGAIDVAVAVLLLIFTRADPVTVRLVSETLFHTVLVPVKTMKPDAPKTIDLVFELVTRYVDVV